MIPSIGDDVLYRSIAGETWDATIVAVRSLLGSTLVDVEVFLPASHEAGLKSTTTLKGVTWHDDPNEQMRGARPKTA